MKKTREQIHNGAVLRKELKSLNRKFKEKNKRRGWPWGAPLGAVTEVINDEIKRMRKRRAKKPKIVGAIKVDDQTIRLTSLGTKKTKAKKKARA